MKILGIIPARYASTRFPGKPLVDINGRSMIQRVYEQSLRSSSLVNVIVATDDERIYKHVKEFGGEVTMTSFAHKTGTDRCNEVISSLSNSFDAVINIQGDEPFIQPEQIDLLASIFDDDYVQIGSLYKPLTENELLLDPNIIKVVINIFDEAIYFSRSPIPFSRNSKNNEWVKKHPYLQHIGIYGYRSDILQEIAQLEPSILEQAESLEQLRWLENGYTISMARTDMSTIAIDTPEDLQRVLNSKELT